MRRRILASLAVAIVISLSIAATRFVRQLSRPSVRPMNCPLSAPTTNDLAGRYRTSDPRMHGDLLDLHADGSFQFTEASGKTGVGKWSLALDFVGCWELMLNYDGPSPEKASFINRPINGRQAPYTIMFFAVQNDPEATVPFSKSTAIPN